MLEIDFTTIIFQVINFLVLVVALYFLLFRKIIQRAETRKREMEKIRSDILNDLQNAERLKNDMELEIQNIDARIEEAFDKAKNDLEGIRNQVLNETREQAEQLLKRSHESFRLAKEQSVEDLQTEIVNTSLNIAKTLLQKVSSEEMHAFLVKEVNDRVLEFGRKEMARVQTIRASLTDREPIVFIETPKPLEKDQQASIIRNFSALADRNVRLDIKQDVNLICGVRVRLGDYIIDNSLQSKLDEMGELTIHELTNNSNSA
jgi:F0F1-type ATP synthase membrane subunit b/b'